MAAVIFMQTVLGTPTRVVDLGTGLTPRLIVEIQGGADAMGGRGWSGMDPIPRAVFEALLIQAGVVH